MRQYTVKTELHFTCLFFFVQFTVLGQFFVSHSCNSGLDRFVYSERAFLYIIISLRELNI